MSSPDAGREPRLHRLTAAAVVVAGLTVAGALLGAVWAWLAPPVNTIVALTRSGERVNGYLGTDADHLFVAAAMFTGLLTMLAVVSAVLVWQWRAHRGPVLVTALWVGQVAAAAVGAGVGVALAHWRYGPADYAGVPLSPENRVHYFTEAPPVFFGHAPLQIATTVLLPAAIAALVYALLVVATPRDDLGGWPEADQYRTPLSQPAGTPT